MIFKDILTTLKVVVFTISLVAILGQWFIAKHYKEKYENTQKELQLAKQVILDKDKELLVSREQCKAQLHIVEFKRDIEDEIEEGVQNDKQTFKITASKDVGTNTTTRSCKFDGTGWVFY